jgi:hypothetical protein
MEAPVTYECWKPVVGYEGVYEVSNHGRVKRVVGGVGATVGRILKGKLTFDGYHVVKLRKGGKERNWRVHRLVAAAFIGKIPEGHDVNHINGCKQTNHVGNLEILTHLDNMRHAFDLGLQPIGMERKNAKLDDEKVIQIKRYLREGVAQKDLAIQFGVHKKAIYDIKKGKRWSHV